MHGELVSRGVYGHGIPSCDGLPSRRVGEVSPVEMRGGSNASKMESSPVGRRRREVPDCSGWPLLPVAPQYRTVTDGGKLCGRQETSFCEADGVFSCKLHVFVDKIILYDT